MNRTLKIAIIGLLLNIAFGGYYFVCGIVTSSWWLLALGTYYVLLSAIRFFVLRGWSSQRGTGVMLMMLSVPLVGTVILSVVRDRGYQLHMIVMIAMAAYAFSKITLATINLVKARKSRNASLEILRNVSLADAFVSIFALQRSMLVSFEGMSAEEIQLMNALLGAAVCIIVFLLGWNLFRRK